MSAVIQNDDTALDELFARYNLGTVGTCTLAANGIENRNYFITLQAADNHDAAPQEFVLTLLQQPSTTGGRAYVELLDTCDRAGLPVPRVIRNAAGRAFDELHGKPALLSPRLTGQHVLNPTLAQSAAIGRFLARLHNSTGHLASYLPAYPRNGPWLSQSLDKIQNWAGYATYEQASHALASVRSMLNRSDVQGLPRSVIHADLFRDNALFNSTGLTGVLDFHHAATGYCLYDLAVATNDWCSDTDGQLDPDRTLTLLRGYHDIRPLSTPELWFFPLFALYAGLVFYLSRAVAAAQRTEQHQSSTKRFKNPDEFERIVQQRLAHSFYLSARML